MRESDAMSPGDAMRRSRSSNRRIRWRRRAAAGLSFVFLLVLIAPADVGAAVPSLPPNTGCDGDAVVAKLSVIEDRAAANMLAETVRSLTRSGRCLLDAGDPSTGHVPAGTRQQASGADRVYVVGGPGAIPDAWLTGTLGVNSSTRIAGGNRWETQAEVANAIIRLTLGQPLEPYSGSQASSPTLPPNTDCTQHTVLVKLNVVEDRAAANMLAEALDVLQTISASARCLVDVGDPQSNQAPASSSRDEANSAATAFVVGGAGAISDSWLNRHFDIPTPTRVSGSDRWATQKAVADLIIELARATSSSGHDAGDVGGGDEPGDADAEN
ncbi:hypothetical protein [Candidatus Poriferisodalis sp.]|uniref:hypothetical protein n=1 Tax=Candidatus Poriferisodalis sp. TaxID=3101277 RepID=UPI003B5B2036